LFANVFNFAYPSNIEFTSVEIFSILVQQTIVYLVSWLLVLFFITLLLIKLDTNKTKYSSLYGLIKNLNVVLSVLIFILTLVKFLIYLWSYKVYSVYLVTFNWFSYKFNYLPMSPIFDLNCSIFSDIIILLAFSSGVVCLHLLGEKNLSKRVSNISIFSSFLIAIVVMVYTSNILVMFIGFECLFLPTLYFVYHHGYVERSDKTLKILLYWTLCGAFLVFCSISYMYVKFKTLNFNILTQSDFSYFEAKILYLFIFIGFGVKVPVFPFHYWLTKIHVEAPAGFSIFLSGFLVKAAIYCFYYLNLIFNNQGMTIIASVVALFGVIESSIKMWTQTDFKKLIAFATIQEMNLILLLLLNYQNVLDYSLTIFILIHGWLSTLMFFLVDIIQKKTNSRNIVILSGLAYNFSELKLIIWFIILVFAGFPLTIKFLIEWQIFGNLIIQTNTLYMFSFLIMISVGVVGFTKQMIIILYGFPRFIGSKNYHLPKRDKSLFYFIICILILLNLLNYILG
jgi:formate hydrogenlyase subunit 3/multisubunit Na+/H+ antiporter MnhD subunit